MCVCACLRVCVGVFVCLCECVYVCVPVCDVESRLFLTLVYDFLEANPRLSVSHFVHEGVSAGAIGTQQEGGKHIYLVCMFSSFRCRCVTAYQLGLVGTQQEEGKHKIIFSSSTCLPLAVLAFILYFVATSVRATLFPRHLESRILFAHGKSSFIPLPDVAEYEKKKQSTENPTHDLLYIAAGKILASSTGLQNTGAA